MSQLHPTPYTLHPRRGFTLVELLVVIALIGILATLTVFALQSARQKTRDAERVSAVNQIRVALELGFAQLANYPTAGEDDVRVGGSGARLLCEVSGAPRFTDSQNECTGTVFMSAVPAAPVPDDGTCTAAENQYRYKAGSGGTDFKLEFCLGRATPQSGLANGVNCATPRGFQPGACE